MSQPWTQPAPTDQLEKLRFENHYYCPDCDVSWDDVWSCQCDDECPECHKDYTAKYSLDVETGKEL
jgi:hypothetical protein